MVFILSVFWWIRIRGLWKIPDGKLTVWETGSCSDVWGHAQVIFNLIFCWWLGLCSLPVVWLEAKLSTLASWRPTGKSDSDWISYHISNYMLRFINSSKHALNILEISSFPTATLGMHMYVTVHVYVTIFTYLSIYRTIISVNIYLYHHITYHLIK